MRRALAALLPLALAALAGCGAGGPSLVPVEGTLTGPDGKPMGDVLIQFSPDASSGEKAVGSSAVTDANGKFALKADTGGAGAVPGTHRVVLIDNAFTAAADDTLGKKGAPKRVNRVPKKYSEPSSTPLKETVSDSKKVYDLQMK